MPYQSTTVTGPLFSPGLVNLPDCHIIFELTSWDSDPTDNIFVTGPFIAPVDLQGNFSVNLFTNTNGINQTVYEIYVSYLDENRKQEYYNPRIKKYIGKTSLTGSGPFCIADLDITSEHAAGSFDLYATMQSLVSDSQTASSEANASATNAASSAQAAADALEDIQEVEHYVFASRYGVVYGDRSEASANTTRLQSANDAAAAAGKKLHLGAGTIFFSPGVTKTTAWVANGMGWWDTRAAANRPSTERTLQAAPTQLVAVGTGTRNLYLPGVSDGAAMGATRTNPSARGSGWNDTVYKYPSFMNTDGTLRAFSAAIIDRTKGMQDYGWRLLPDFGGTHGLDGYNDAAENGRSTADVDVGIVYEDCDGHKVSEVACVGHWRICARLIPSVGLYDGSGALGDNTVTPYNMTFTDCVFQGYWGALELGSDCYRVVSVSTNTVQVPWASTMALRASVVWPQVRVAALDSWSTSSIGANITSVTQNGGNPALADVVFDADVSGSVSVGQELVCRGFGGGNSHLIDERPRFAGFTFPNAAMAHDSNSVAAGAAFDAPSGGWGFSGWRSTERILIAPMFQHTEEVAFHVHDVARIQITHLEVEKDPDTNAGSTAMRFIVSPSASDNTHFTNACGGSQFFFIDSQSGTRFPGMDWGPSIDVDRAATFNGSGDTGFFEPNALVMPSYSGSDAWEGPFLKPFDGGTAGIRKGGHPSSANAFVYDDSDDTLKAFAPIESTATATFGDTTVTASLGFVFLTVEAVQAGRDPILQMNTSTSEMRFKVDQSSGDDVILEVDRGKTGTFSQVWRDEGGATEPGVHMVRPFFADENAYAKKKLAIGETALLTYDADLIVGKTSGDSCSVVMLDGNEIGGTEFSIEDDTVVEVTPPRKGGFLLLTARGDDGFPQSTYSGMFWFDVGSSNAMVQLNPAEWAGTTGVFGVNAAVSNTNLTGTAGVDGNLTLYAKSDGNIQFENRSGATLPVNVTFL